VRINRYVIKGHSLPKATRIATTILPLAWFSFFVLISPEWFLKIPIAIGCLYPVFLLWQIWRDRNGWQVRMTTDGYGSRAGVGTIKMKRWAPNDEEINLTRQKNGAYELVIRRILGERAALRIWCTDDEAETLRDRIHALSKMRVWIEK
jgi:hypothetical protein